MTGRIEMSFMEVRKAGKEQEFGFEQLHLDCLLAILRQLSSRQLGMSIWSSRGRPDLEIQIWSQLVYSILKLNFSFLVIAYPFSFFSWKFKYLHKLKRLCNEPQCTLSTSFSNSQLTANLVPPIYPPFAQLL